MSVDYQFTVVDHDGQQVGPPLEPLFAEAVLVANGVGGFQIGLPEHVNEDAIRVDYLIEMRRKAFGAASMRFFTGMARKYRWAMDDDGREVVTISGPCLNDLLARRIVAEYAGTAKADMTDQIDDMMKAIVTDAMGSDAATARQLTDWLTVETDRAAAASVTKAFAWRNVLTVLQGLAEIAEAKGNKVYFGVEHIGAADLVFRTSLDYWGIDRSYGSTSEIQAATVLFSQQGANLSNPVLEHDYADEVNYVYAGGRGEGTDRNVQEVSDADRMARSVWNRREAFADARNADDNNAVTSEGNERLNEGKPRLRFTADVLDVPGARYGIEWGFGDKVTAEYRGRSFDGVIEAVRFSLAEGGQDSIVGKLVVEDVL